MVASIFKMAVLIDLGGGNLVIPMLMAFDRLWSSTMISLFLFISCCFYSTIKINKLTTTINNDPPWYSLKDARLSCLNTQQKKKKKEVMEFYSQHRARIFRNRQRWERKTRLVGWNFLTLTMRCSANICSPRKREAEARTGGWKCGENVFADQSAK